MEYLGIKNKETDTVDNTRVWVEIDKDELIMFKFNHDPTEEEVITITNNYIKNIEDNKKELEDGTTD